MARLDFRRNTDSTEGSGKRTRRWIIGFVLLLGLTIVVADRAREPSTWRWLDLLADASEEPPGVGVDNRLRPEDREALASDRFVIKTPPELDNRKATGNSGDYFPGVDAELLSLVKDKTLFSNEDNASSHNLLDVLNRTDEKKLREAAESDATYAQLFNQPKHYRGRLVTVSGRVIRATRMPLPHNEYGLTHYYEVVLYPNVKPRSPILLYSLELPKDFPTGSELSEKAEATGFFFKNCVYPWGNEFYVVPAVLSKTLHWHKPPPPPAEESSSEGRMILLGAGIAVLCAALMALFVYARTRPPRAMLPDDEPNFDMLEEMDRGNETTEDR